MASRPLSVGLTDLCSIRVPKVTCCNLLASISPTQGWQPSETDHGVAIRDDKVQHAHVSNAELIGCGVQLPDHLASLYELTSLQIAQLDVVIYCGRDF